MGCRTSQVFPRPLADVRRVVEEMQPDMLAEISPECHRAGLQTNDVAGAVYALHIQDIFRSDPWFPYLTVEARSKSESRTKVTITRVAVDKGASFGAARRRDLERRRMDALAAKLEETK
jgi:hypothetical protein